MERIEVLALSDAFAALKANPAFELIMESLKARRASAEALAMDAGSELETREVRNRMIAWQECSKVLQDIDLHFEQIAAMKRREDEDIANERAIEHERRTRTGW